MYAPAQKAVRAYRKLIYAPVVEQEQLAQEYLAAEQLGEPAEEARGREAVGVMHESHSDAFDVSLAPETTVVYPLQGAEIESMRIFDANDHAVNVLHSGNTYRFVVCGRFMADVDGVYFGIHIRAISGLAITGQRHPEEGKRIENVRNGQRFKITFGFKMVMLPGVYFVGGGIWSYQEPNCLHRILDALMFRVVSEGNTKSFGYVDASSSDPVIELV
jgi:lipopolysaccharide transport system ATP-binding protein